MNKICRLSDIESDCPIEPDITEGSIALNILADQYFLENPGLVKIDFYFLKMGDEFIWKFRDCGMKNLFFPMDRLPKQLEDYLNEKTKVMDEQN